jgi:hypothetical protein
MAANALADDLATAVSGSGKEQMTTAQLTR